MMKILMLGLTKCDLVYSSSTMDWHIKSPCEFSLKVPVTGRIRFVIFENIRYYYSDSKTNFDISLNLTQRMTVVGCKYKIERKEKNTETSCAPQYCATKIN